jgi:hypothetical protein
MLLGFLTILIMLAVGYAYWREGIFTAAVMCCNVFLAGLVAFNFWEPLADLIDPYLRGTFLHGYEDAACLMTLFCLTLGLLRLMTNSLASTLIPFPFWLHYGGGLLFGLITGYLVSGFLVCLLQTLPWQENFLFFDPKYEPGPEHLFRRVLPPDRVWLGLMHRGGAYAFANQVDETVPDPQSLYEKYLTFDKYATFELRYARLRRYPDSAETTRKYLGEFDQQLHRR